jgi:2-oxoglutarate ferredoxin oxidoreductase subunit alpha
MREPLEMYEPSERGIDIIKPYPLLGLEGHIGTDREPQHLRNIYSMEEELYDVVLKNDADYNSVRQEITEYSEFNCENAEVIIISHGVVSRAAEDAVKVLRAQGIKAGSFRPITLRPFPREQLLAVLEKSNAKKLLITESALGQLERIVKYEIYGQTLPIETLFMPGVGIIDYDIIQKIKSII